ncbi:MAG: ABC transporter ATP-binding protein [Acidimicrobiia bacterium]|nr:ABC transporter ATP-binding protein [Acidimicrobiia bacterium]MYA39371.1 ABC transporter ATP-binding protein [Acidimicrobiia bacterium]MYD41881.1 ABC transporter ATP-binding protein [Acidimicrobiia bacterium]MYG92899.1 ABC transporter ATP-binding protein [Acidimicrobiia bacterium]MYK56065.1 ABC transporter ATP-binding protein [Acidimicrobiia bacterium]
MTGPAPPDKSPAEGRPLLEVGNLSISFDTRSGVLSAVEDVSFVLHPGDILGVVGESGSGKTVTVSSLVGLLPDNARIDGGRVLYRGRDLLTLSDRELERIRGKEIAMVFQDPMTSLNPVMRVGLQIAEALRIHGFSRSDARERALELLDLVGIPNPRQRYRQFPHELSGGMRQRVVIAVAIANQPAVLIADEPTTALDVTIQAQVLEVLAAGCGASGASMILVTHDLGVIAEVADRVAVMYAGRIVETGTVETIFEKPRHPYTMGLFSSLPRLDAKLEHLQPIPGVPPTLAARPAGCAFQTRCALSAGRQPCRDQVPELTSLGGGQSGACHYLAETG